jgi:hypothetical protein
MPALPALAIVPHLACSRQHLCMSPLSIAMPASRQVLLCAAFCSSASTLVHNAVNVALCVAICADCLQTSVSQMSASMKEVRHYSSSNGTCGSN